MLPPSLIIESARTPGEPSREDCVGWLHHRGFDVLFIDFRPCQKPAYVIRAVDWAAEEFARTPGRLRVIGDITGSAASVDVIRHANEVGARVFAPRTAAGAIIGVHGLLRFFFDAYIFATGQKMTACANFQQALEIVTRP